jgi:hypothetical protein
VKTDLTEKDINQEEDANGQYTGEYDKALL